MPQYSYHCRECSHEWQERHPMSESSVLTDCPGCGANANHRVVSTPALHVEGSNNTFGYKFGKNMDKAKEIRHNHEEKFGDYDDFTGSRSGAPRRLIDPDEDITYIGDVDKRTFEEVTNNEHQKK